MAFTVFMIGAVGVIVLSAITRWINVARRRRTLPAC
jgi:hypothetical protein